METSLYGVPLQSDLYDLIVERFKVMKATIAKRFADGFQFNDLKAILVEFVDSGAVLLEQLDLAGPNKKQILIGALMEFYDSTIPDFPGKWAMRYAVEFGAGLLIDVIVDQNNKVGWTDPTATRPQKEGL